jgi:diacylglycerol kinase family enzyme
MTSASFGVCLNTDPYTFFGKRPMHLAKGTSLLTPLAVVTFDKLTLTSIVPVLTAVFRQGLSKGRGRNVALARGVRFATLTGLRPLPYQLDGDYVGEAERIELRWAEAALSLVKPVDGQHGAPRRAVAVRGLNGGGKG